MIENLLLGFVVALITQYMKRKNLDTRLVATLMAFAVVIVYISLTHVYAVSVAKLVRLGFDVLAYATLVDCFGLHYFFVDRN